MELSVRFLNEDDLDEAIRAGQLFHIYDLWELPFNWRDVQDEEIETFQTQMAASYSEEEFYISDETWPNDSRGTDADKSIITPQFFSRLLCFLRNSSATCILSAVFEGESHYLGRFALRPHELVVEESLREWWQTTFEAGSLILREEVTELP
jgi:hypothetical protein